MGEERGEMTERPIPFSGPEVRAILEGRKTQTRRVVFNGRVSSPLTSPDCFNSDGYQCVSDHAIIRVPWTAEWITKLIRCPHGVPGDRLWVREGFMAHECVCESAKDRLVSDCVYCHGKRLNTVAYRADWERADGPQIWRPSIHMPRWASRITLEVTDVRVQRVREISHRDALAEGVQYNVSQPDGAPLPRFRKLWDSTYAKRGRGWDANPWVWYISFRRIT